MDKTDFADAGNNTGQMKSFQGYLNALGETCGALFGQRGASRFHLAVAGSYFGQLRKSASVQLTQSSPWERLRETTHLLESQGFCPHIEVEMRDDGACQILQPSWQQGNSSWNTGMPSSVLWSLLQYSLSEIGYEMSVIDPPSGSSENASAVVFRFVSTPPNNQNPLDTAREAIQSAVVPVCPSCKRIRSHNGGWEHADVYFKTHQKNELSHTYCPDCAEIAAEEMRDSGPVAATTSTTRTPEVCCAVEEGDWMYTI